MRPAAIRRLGARGGRIGDQRTRGGLLRTHPGGRGAARALGQLQSKRTVAAGIEKEQRDLRSSVELVEDQPEIQRFEWQIARCLRTRRYRQQPVPAGDLHAVAGEEEHGGLGAAGAFTEPSHGRFQRGTIRVGDQVDIKTEAPQRRSDLCRIRKRVREMWHGDIGTGADHESDTPLRRRGRAGECHRQGTCCECQHAKQ